MKKIITFFSVITLFLILSIGVVSAEINSITPSTNDTNRTNGWAHVDQISQGVGTTDLKFISTRNFYSCFEYRTDGDTTQKISDTNYNISITDGLYPYVCVKNNEIEKTISANEYVEVRMVFGAETDERFDWTRFDVLPEPGEIILPTPGQEIFKGDMLNLEAKDVGAKNGKVSWAVRFGSCAANTGTIAGNVDGFNTSYFWEEGIFKSEIDTSEWEVGEYCFVFNPSEGGRYTQWFFLVEKNPTTKQECMKGGWEDFGFRNQGQCIRFVETGKDSR